MKVRKMRQHFLRACLPLSVALLAPVLCSAQDDDALRERLRDKQRAAQAAEECERLIEAGDFLEARGPCETAYELRSQDLRSAWNLDLSSLSRGDVGGARDSFEIIQRRLLILRRLSRRTAALQAAETPAPDTGNDGHRCL